MRYDESGIPEPGVPSPDWDMPRWDGPTPVLVRALERAQADLDAAGLDSFRISYAVAGGSEGCPTVNVQWRGTWTSDGVDLQEQDLAAVTVDVAAQLAQGLVELEGVYWPVCLTHSRRSKARVSARGDAVWWCDQRGATAHEVSKIGDYATSRTRRSHGRPGWRRLDELPRP